MISVLKVRYIVSLIYDDYMEQVILAERHMINNFGNNISIKVVLIEVMNPYFKETYDENCKQTS